MVKILQQANKPKGINMFINEDLIRETMELHKQFWKEVRAHCDKGRVAYLIYKTVIVKKGGNFVNKLINWHYLLNATLRFDWIKISPEPNFESMSFNPLSSNKNFPESNQDLDVKFFLDDILSLNTEYFLSSDVKIGFSKLESPGTISVLHLNNINWRKNFEDFTQKPGQMTINERINL